MNLTAIKYCCILWLCLVLTPAYAAELDLGVDYLSGKDESRALVLGLNVPLHKEVSLSSKIRYAKRNSDISQNQGLLRAAWDPKLTEDWSLWFYEQAGYDTPKKIEFENFMGGGPKYTLHKSSTSKYSISAGYLNHYQELSEGDITDVHRLSFRLKAKQLIYFNLLLPGGKIIGEGPKIIAVFFYQPNIENPGDYLFSGEISLVIAVSESIDLKAYIEDHYRSVSEIPQKNELLTGLKLAWSF